MTKIGAVQSSDNIVFFGGAGVSTEIPDFSTNGLYRQGGIKVENMTIGPGPSRMAITGKEYDLGNGVTVDPDNEESLPTARRQTLHLKRSSCSMCF